MTKNDVATEISKKTGLTEDQSALAVNAFMQVVRDSMQEGKNIYLRGFGTFLLKKRAAKVAQDINKGTPIQLPARNVPAFKPCIDFKKSIR
jgi:DNA-binding protein HU-beta